MTVLRGSVRVGAELLVTLGLVVVAFAVYLLFWSDVQNAAAQDDLRSTFDAQVAQASRVKGSDQAVQQVAAPATGAALGVLTIPRLGSDWSRVMVEGVESEELALGPGHFPGTAMPGQVGNFAVAGHRATNGEPFAHLDTLEPGDKVVGRDRRPAVHLRRRRHRHRRPHQHRRARAGAGQARREPEARQADAGHLQPAVGLDRADDRVRPPGQHRRHDGSLSVYATLWRLLPGPLPVRLALALALVAAAVLMLFLFVFPLVEPLLPFDQITLAP